VVDEQQKVVGMITDRDICMAAMMKNRPISEILVSEVISGNVKSCSPGDDLEDALKKMKKTQVRRLPVGNRDGALVGIISLSDVLRNAKEISRKKLVAALQEISHFHAVTLHALDSEEIDEEGGDEKGANQADEREDDEDDSDYQLADDSDEKAADRSSKSNGASRADSDVGLAENSDVNLSGNSHDVSANVYGSDQTQL
jgi:predicted transcriptional regulator